MTDSEVPTENPVPQKLTGEKETTPTNQNISSGPSADFTALIDAINAEGRAYRAEEQSEDRAKRFREWLTIALLLLTVIGIFWQVHEMIIAYEPIRDQAIASQKAAEASTEAAKAAVKQSESAVEGSSLTRESNQINRDAIATSNRAWVGISKANIIGSVVLNAPAVINISVFNSGREPAKNFSRDVDILTMTGDSVMLNMDMQNYVRRCFATAAKPQAQVIYPSAGFAGTGFDSQYTVNADKIDQGIVNGQTMILVRGCLTYQTSGKTKHSSFCFFYKGGLTKAESLNICESGADAD